MALNKVEICGVNTSGLPVLTNEEKELLFEKIKKGDKEARELYIKGNLRLVLSVIKRFSGSNENADDLFQIGCIGLMKAIDNFDTTLQVKFSTYAVPMIIGEIKRFLRDVNSLRVSRSIRDTAYQVLKTRGELERRDEEVSVDKIAAAMNVAVSEVVYALDAISDTLSLYDPVFNKQGDTLLLMDQIGDERNTGENWTEKVALETASDGLSDLEKRILFLRYYEGRTQTEISDEVGISQAQVSRLEKNALRTIRARMEG